MENAANLKHTEDYQNVYINASLCPEFRFLNYAVRRAKRNGEIYYYKVRNGVTLIQLRENGQFVEITHINDLETNGITVPERLF